MKAEQPSLTTAVDPRLISELVLALRPLTGAIQFGKVELVFHQGRLVQLEKTERVRLEAIKIS